jgi:hypothetical protein
MAQRRGRTAVAVLALLGLAVPGMASPIPSKVEGASTTDPSRTDRATVEAFLARAEVARALAAQGLSEEQVEARVAKLSREDLSTLAANLDQIQAAGAVPNYIWILLAILMGVTILATVF